MKYTKWRLFGAIILLVQTFCHGLPGFEAPYYLHFPPIPYNHIEFNGPLPQPLPPWLQNPQQNPQNQTQTNRNAVTPAGPTVGTLRLHLANPTRVNSPPQTLNNGTILYYLSGPWGALKSVPFNQNIDNTITTTPQNWQLPSITTSGPFSFINRNQEQPQTQAPLTNNNLNPTNGNYPWTQPNFGWGGWGSVYNGPSLTTQNPTETSSPETVNREQTSTTTQGGMTSTTDGTTSVAPTNETSTVPSGSSSDSILKFRRIVSRIREIARQELKKP